MQAFDSSHPKQGTFKACRMSVVHPKQFCNHHELRRLAGSFRGTQKRCDSASLGPRSNSWRSHCGFPVCHRYPKALLMWAVPGRQLLCLRGKSCWCVRAQSDSFTGTLRQSSQSPSGRWASHIQRARYHKATWQGQWRDCAQLEGSSTGGSTGQSCGVETDTWLKCQLCASWLLDLGLPPSLLYQLPHLQNGVKIITTSQAAYKNDVCKLPGI